MSPKYNTLYNLYVLSNDLNSMDTNSSLCVCTEQCQMGIHTLGKLKRAYIPSSSHGRHTNDVLCQGDFEIFVRSQLIEGLLALLSYEKHPNLARHSKLGTNYM